MGDINRAPSDNSMHYMHAHHCPNCKRKYNCNCSKQPGQTQLVCTDCERGRYDPMIHGGEGTKQEA